VRLKIRAGPTASITTSVQTEMFRDLDEVFILQRLWCNDA
jgi:hypothetical protein